jgi:ribosomal protein S18 acetylase RimI-like enzyme
MTAIREATPADLERLLPHVATFHEHEHIVLSAADRRAALARLLGEAGFGRVLIAESTPGGDVVGYAILCFGYSVEFGGRDAFVDELYVVEAARGAGIGQRLVAACEHSARAAGVRAIHLEADHANPRAAALYRRIGFADHARHLMTKRLG